MDNNQRVLATRTLEATCIHSIIEGELSLGSQFAAGHVDAMLGISLDPAYLLKRLNKGNITHILCVTRLTPLNLPGITQRVIEMSDDSSFDLSSVLDATYLFIDNAITSGGKVLVHCQMGQSRSAAIVIAYLMRKYGIPFEVAFAHTKKKRELVSQERFGPQLRNLEQMLMTQNPNHPKWIQ